ncbi:MAG: hypothetical protein ABWK01_03075 [Infirmifilum sp.]
MSDIISQVKRQKLPMYILLLVASVLLTLALLYFYLRTSADSYLSGAILLIMIDGYIAWSFYKLVTIKSEKKRLISHIRCENCGYEFDRDYKEDDYLFKIVDNCPKCNNGKLVVEAIFLRIETTRTGKPE